MNRTTFRPWLQPGATLSQSHPRSGSVPTPNADSNIGDIEHVPHPPVTSQALG